MKIIHPQCYLCTTTNEEKRKEEKKIKLVLFDEKLSFLMKLFFCVHTYVRTWMFLMLIEVSWIVAIMKIYCAFCYKVWMLWLEVDFIDMKLLLIILTYFS